MWCPTAASSPTGTAAEMPSNGTIAPRGRRMPHLYRPLRPGAEAVERAPMVAPEAVTRALLDVHKAALAVERVGLERVHGRLRPLNELILAFEETGEERAPEAELLRRARELLVPPKAQTPFGRRYLSLMQREPALVLAHRDLVKLLGSGRDAA